MQTGSPKWRRRSEARPGEIVQAALEVFAEKGFAAARLDDIAAKAGISKGALYLYFETKEDMFRAVVREAVVPNIGMVEAMLAQATMPFPDLLRLAFARIETVIETSRLGAVAKLVDRRVPQFSRAGQGLARRGCQPGAGGDGRRAQSRPDAGRDPAGRSPHPSLQHHRAPSCWA
jgi:AcrR family transcriptional regulator